jgi:hypothetical protein
MQFSVWQGNGDTEPKTMQRIAKALGLVPSYKVTQILLEMEEEGKLVTEMRDQSGRWTTRFYALAPDADIIASNILRRKITVSKRGVAVGQLEIFS